MAPATDMAASMATNTAARFSQADALPAQPAMPPITLVATKAPSAMNTPWPKFSTSIRPKTRVRPEAMTKTMKPIASPATVSVSQLLPLPMAGNAATIKATSSASGIQSKLALGTAAAAAAGVATVLTRASWGAARRFSRAPASARAAAPQRSLMGSQREPEQALLQRLVVDQFLHFAAVHDAAVVHHRDAVADGLGHHEVLLDEQDRRALALEFAKGRDQVLD